MDYLKFGVKSIRKFIVDTFYTKNIVFEKLFPCTDETYYRLATLSGKFIYLVGLPRTFHSEKYMNFK